MIVTYEIGPGPDGRNETEIQRLDRHWADLLQELRVAQTGVQLLTGLLLTLPFQARFTELSSELRVIYLVVVSLSMSATGLLVAPVSLHRALFRQRARRELVTAAHVLAVGGLVLLGVAVAGMAVLIFGTVLGPLAGIIAGGSALALFGGLWWLLPWSWRLRIRRASELTPARRNRAR